jgi:bacteriocin-like protein
MMNINETASIEILSEDELSLVSGGCSRHYYGGGRGRGGNAQAAAFAVVASNNENENENNNTNVASNNISFNPTIVINVDD